MIDSDSFLLGLSENQHGFLVHSKFSLLKLTHINLNILRFIDRVVGVCRKSLRFTEILQRSLANYLGCFIILHSCVCLDRPIQ
jgi:hypothetical protein